MNLWKITVNVKQPQIVVVEEILGYHAEALSSYEAGSEIDWKVEAYFLPHVEKNFLEATLIAEVQDQLKLKAEDVFLELLPRADWLAQSYASFPPLTAGRFFIHGSHYEGILPKGLHALEINAATAFGSGEHQSTFGCLLALSLLSKKINPQKILDMGTGTGILAMAASKLWSQKVLAVDCDPESIRVTDENASLNKMASMIDAYCGHGYKSQKVKGQKFDLIIANILARPLMQMAVDMKKCLAPNGFVILAGLLGRQENMVLYAHFMQDLKLYKRIRLGEWTCLILTHQIKESL